MGDSRLNARGLLKEALSPQGACATLIELDGLDDGSLTESAMRRVRGHLEHCARCQTELALLHEFERASPRAGEEAAARWITSQLEEKFAAPLPKPQAERREEQRPRSRFFSALRPMRAGGFAVAAALLVAAVGIALRDGRPPQIASSVPDHQIFRSAEISVVAPPENPARAPSELRWAAWDNADSYSVRVMEVDRK